MEFLPPFSEVCRWGFFHHNLCPFRPIFALVIVVLARFAQYNSSKSFPPKAMFVGLPRATLDCASISLSKLSLPLRELGFEGGDGGFE